MRRGKQNQDESSKDRQVYLCKIYRLNQINLYKNEWKKMMTVRKLG